MNLNVLFVTQPIHRIDFNGFFTAVFDLKTLALKEIRMYL